MHYTFAKEHQEGEKKIAQAHAYDAYAHAHENPAEYAAARAAVEQAGLLEQLMTEYTVARKAAELEADKIRSGQLQRKPLDVME